MLKLKVKGAEKLMCSYCVGDGSEFTPNSFKRRAYWLIERPKWVLVHYMTEIGQPNEEIKFDLGEFEKELFSEGEKEINSYMMSLD
jgi:hypothetical protein